MPLQITEEIPLGGLQVSKNRTMVLSIPKLGSGLAVVLYDPVSKVGGMAHIALPDSAGEVVPEDCPPAKFANLAIPTLLKRFLAEGGEKQNAVVKMTGGAQLFNFGGGGGNPLNIGSRNAIAVRAALSKEGLAVEKADVGGNKGKSVRFVIATGQLFVNQIGGREVLL